MPGHYQQRTLVTANARLSRQLRREYDAAQRKQGLSVWESPDMVSRDAWLVRVWQDCVYRDPENTPQLLSSTQEQVLWEQAISQSDVDDVLLDVPSTAATAARAWALLHLWDVAIDPAEFAGLRDPEAFLQWFRFVKNHLRERGWITAAELPTALSTRLTREMLPHGVAYTGFDELTPADRRLFAVCGAMEWIAPALNQTQASRAASDSAAEELMQAACWARRKLETAPGARIGVVVRGLAAQSSTVERVFDDVLHPGLAFGPSARRAFHVSAGVASSDVPMISAALGALRLHPGMPLADAGMLLRSPFLSVERPVAAALAMDLRKRGVDKVSLRVDIVQRAFPVFAKAAAELRQRQHPGEWSTHFSKLLTKAGWPGTRPLSPEEYQTLQHWKDLLSELAALDLVLPRITYEQALSRLRQIARERRFAPSEGGWTSEGAPIQIMDMREAAGSRFDALWIAGMNANAWPEAARPNPFLPGSVQRAAGLPHSSPERELAYARRVTARLLRSAPEVLCSFARHTGEEVLRMSPLIEELPEIQEAAPALESIASRIFSTGAPLEMHAHDPAPPVVPGNLQHGGMSVLKDQAACPFRAFAIHRLGAREPDAADLGISATERGSVAHRALETFWREVQSQEELLALAPGELSSLVERCVNTALDGQLSRRQRSKSLERARALELERWQRVLLEWLTEEKARTPFEVVERELARRVTVGGLTLEIKADRLDRLGDDTYAILDYKTSDRLNVKDWDGERPDAPQLPLYAAKSEHEISAVYFAQLVPGDVKILGHDGGDLRPHLTDWKRVVDQLGESFKRGEAAVDPKHPVKTCEFCDLSALCRIAELGKTEDTEENGE
jgi:ATP-dependent helicase/nuclease subunit B